MVFILTLQHKQNRNMAKEKTAFFCKECGNESPKWFGKCPACGAWNTCVEETVVTGKDSKSVKKNVGLEMDKGLPVPINEIGNAKEQRIILPYEELNRVLGGGLVLGSLTLVGGEPARAVLLKLKCVYSTWGSP